MYRIVFSSKADEDDEKQMKYFVKTTDYFPHIQTFLQKNYSQSKKISNFALD